MGYIGFRPEGEYISRDMVERSLGEEGAVADDRSKCFMSYVRFRWRTQLDSGVC
jgi:hypothetical protein